MNVRFQEFFDLLEWTILLALRHSNFEMDRAMAQYSNGTTADVTTSATWTSSNNQVATFVVFAGRPVLSTFQRGTVVITASYGGKTATITVTVA